MNDYAEILAGLEQTFAQAVRLSKAPAPDAFLCVVDLYGEPLDGDPRVRTMPDWKSSAFTGRFRRWLGEMSSELRHASLDEAAIALRASSEFSGQFLVFTRPGELAQWYSQPERNVLDAYVDHYVHDGLPIFAISLFIDGRQPKLRRNKHN